MTIPFHYIGIGLRIIQPLMKNIQQKNLLDKPINAEA